MTQKYLRHVVLLQFTDDASQEQIVEVGEAFVALSSEIEVIQQLEWGGAINDGTTYSHCLLVTFRNEDDLEAYGKHPAHEAIPTQFGHLIAGVTVVDYWT